MKTCTACGEHKRLADFYWTTRRNGERARHSKCQSCRREQFKLYQKTAGAKEARRSRLLFEKYKMTEAEYEVLNAQQSGVCAICQEPETKIHREGGLCRLVVDHNHRTGDVRALLCSACNVGLGSFRDNPDRLLAAVRYLQRQPVKEEPPGVSNVPLLKGHVRA